MFKVMIQLGLSFMLFLFSTLAAWYEGSNILQDFREWKYTAVFSQIINGEVAHSSNILLIDYFVYAAKFFPTFPTLMLLSGTHLVLLIGYILLKRSQKMFASFLSFIGILFLAISGLIANSSIGGLQTFFNLFLLIGMTLIVAAFVRIFSVRTKEVY